MPWWEDVLEQLRHRDATQVLRQGENGRLLNLLNALQEAEPFELRRADKEA
jgi:hypothetical protein